MILRLLRASYRKLAVVIAITSLVASANTTAATFSAQTRNSNLLSTGTVNLSDNDSGANIFSLTNLKTNDSGGGCINVTYSGSLPSTVKLTGTVSGALADDIFVTVTRGTSSGGTFPSCANFSPDATVYAPGQPVGLMWAGPLGSLSSAFSAGIDDPTTATPESWTTNETHSYKVSIATTDDLDLLNKSATATFTWTASSS